MSSQSTEQRDEWRKLQDCPPGTSYTHFVINPDRPEEAKVYARPRWFRVKTMDIMDYYATCSVRFDATASIRHRAPEGAKENLPPSCPNTPVQAAVDKAPLAAAEGAGNGDLAAEAAAAAAGPQQGPGGGLEDLTGMSWAGVYAYNTVPVGVLPEFSSERYEARVIDDMGTIGRFPKLYLLPAGDNPVGCVVSSILNAASFPIIESEQCGDLLKYSALAMTVEEPALRNSASIDDVTNMIKRTGVLQLRRLPESTDAFGDSSRLRDSRSLMEACCGVVGTELPADLGLGVALVDCEVDAPNGEATTQFGHRIAIDLQDGLFACSAEKQTYPLIVSALKEKGIFGFRDLRVIHPSNPSGIAISKKAILRLQKWRDVVDGPPAVCRGSDGDEPLKKKKAV